MNANYDVQNDSLANALTFCMLLLSWCLIIWWIASKAEGYTRTLPVVLGKHGICVLALAGTPCRDTEPRHSTSIEVYEL
jgi:hypothetical protein